MARSYTYTCIELYKLVTKRVPGKSVTSFVMKEEKVVVVSSKAASKASSSSSSKRRKKNDDDDDVEADTGQKWWLSRIKNLTISSLPLFIHTYTVSIFSPFCSPSPLLF